MFFGSIEVVLNVVMVNFLGEKGYYGKFVYDGVSEVFRIFGVFVYVYGKREVFFFRKMGYVIVVDRIFLGVIEKVLRVKVLIRVRGEVNV